MFSIGLLISVVPSVRASVCPCRFVYDLQVTNENLFPFCFASWCNYIPMKDERQARKKYHRKPWRRPHESLISTSGLEKRLSVTINATQLIIATSVVEIFGKQLWVNFSAYSLSSRKYSTEHYFNKKKKKKASKEKHKEKFLKTYLHF